MIGRAAALVIAALCGSTVAIPAVAQEAGDERLGALETRLDALSRQTEAIARQERRLQELEDSLRAVTGRMEENRHLLDQLHRQLQQLEETQAVPGDALPPPLPAPTADTVPAAPVVGTGPETENVVAQDPPSGSATEVPGPVTATQFDDEETSYRQAYELLVRADYAAAEAAFRDFIRRYPNGTLTDNAYYWLGESHYVREQYAEAAAEFARGFRSAPDKQKAPDILLKLGLSLIALGKNDDACEAFRRLGLDFPDASKRILDRAVLGSERAGCT
ncbi:MAG: tol-pal system protein YbgF [Rhodospirillales bacterium]|nr:tol-pal system protein YbgF [Rhodospirillales bacterium]MYE18743.1 tol-pal system protein YbgF [Rhodospirillales bacterium]